MECKTTHYQLVTTDVTKISKKLTRSGLWIIKIVWNIWVRYNRLIFCTPFLLTCCICITELPSLIQLVHTRTKIKKILVISKFPPQKLKSSFHVPKNYLRVYLSISNSSPYLQKSSCSFNKNVPVHFPVGCLIGTETQKINSARHGTDSSYPPPHLPPLNFTGNGISRPLRAKHMKEHVLIFLNRENVPGSLLLILGWCNSVQTQAGSSSCKYSF